MKHEALNHLRTLELTAEATIATAQNTPYVSLKNYRSVVFTFLGDIGRTGASDDTTITIQQATTNSGGDVKAITPRRAYRREALTFVEASQAIPTELAGNAMLTNGNQISIVDIEIDASELDVSNGFAYVRARFAAVASGTRRARFAAIAYGPRYATDPVHLADPTA